MTKYRHFIATSFLLCVLFLTLSCQRVATAPHTHVTRAVTADAPLRVVATTGMIADTARRVGGNYVQVTGLMGPGVDPHLYKASEGDINTLGTAEIIFYNGLNLEGKMNDLFVKMARNITTVAVTQDIDPASLREPPELDGHHDPHIWFDVTLWQSAVTAIEQTLIARDSANAEHYRRNAASYQAELTALHDWCKSSLAAVPRTQRVLMTAHDAFGYFGRAYDVDVVGLQGISTVAEFGVADINRLVEMIVARNIPAVFVESSIPQQSIAAVVAAAQARGHTVRIGGTLYSDALGAADGPAGTYIGMVRTNVTTIVQALSGQ